MDKNRYYIPVNNVLDEFGIDYIVKDEKVHIESDGKKIDIGKTVANVLGEKYKLRKDSILNKDIMYIYLFDFAKILGLKANWNESEKTIVLYKNKIQEKITK